MAHTQSTEVVNPATGEVVASIPLNSVEELNQAVARAREAQKIWASYSFDRRAAHLRKIRSFVVEHADEIARVIVANTGKTLLDALTTEVVATATSLGWYGKAAKKFLSPKRIPTGSILTINKRPTLERVPYGVIGIISPWNYPFGIPFHEIAMALAAGNGVVIKVASQTLGVGEIIAKCVAAGEFPKGLFAMVNLPGSVAGKAFVESGIDKLFFTGSTATGKKLMALAAEKLLPLSLELGGNDPMIVCADADLDRAVNGAIWAGLSNCGQSCAAVERIYVEEPVYDRFVSLLKKRISTLKQGFDTDATADIGSLTTRGQYDTVKSLLDDATAKGATIWRAPGAPQNGNGLFFPPTVLENVTDEMKVMTEEIFGPLLPVSKFRSLDEAVSRANNSVYGLTASVWTSDGAKAKAIASRLQAGAVTINDHLMSHGLAETPWGGFKESGSGRTHCHIGLEAMTQPRVIITDWFGALKRNMWWHPYDASVYKGMKGAIEFLYSPRLSKRLSGLFALVRTFLRSFKAA